MGDFGGGLFSENYSVESSLYDICLAFSLTESQTFIVNGWLHESRTIVYNVVTSWHHLLVVLCSKTVYQIKLKCQLYKVLDHRDMLQGVIFI